MAERLNEQFRREQRTQVAWKEKYGRKEDYLYPQDAAKAENLRALKALTDKATRAEYASADERLQALEELRAHMAQCAADVDESLGQ